MGKEEEEELFKMNRSIEEINKIVDAVMSDQDVQDALNNRILAENLEYLKKKKAYEDGEEHGREEGEHEKTIEIVKKMISENIEDSIIIKVTKISEKELEELKK